jgi:hypothetical protein
MYGRKANLIIGRFPAKWLPFSSSEWRVIRPESASTTTSNRTQWVSIQSIYLQRVPDLASRAPTVIH